jgi:hypothetical protein
MKTAKNNYRTALIAAALVAAPVGVSMATEATGSPPKRPSFWPDPRLAGRSREGMWIQAYSRKWYYAEFMGRCFGLNFATAVGFDNRFQSSFDRFSSVFVPGYGRCAITSLQPSDGPPRKKKPAKNSDTSETQGEPVQVVSADNPPFPPEPEADEIAGSTP